MYHNTWENEATPKEIVESLKSLLSNTSKYQFDDERRYYEQIIDDEGKIWVYFWGNWRGTLKANGKELQIPVQLSAHMVNGKIVEEYATYDVSEINSELQGINAANNTPKKNASIVNTMYAAFAIGDIPSVLEKLDDNVIWNEAEGNSYADGNPYVGPDAVLNGIFKRIGDDYEYFHLDGIQLHEMANNQILANMRYKAKLKKNGAVIDAQAAHLWTLKDGKAIGFQQYVDTKQLDEALNK